MGESKQKGWILCTAMGTFVAVSLACSGVTGPNVGAHTKRLAEHLSQDGVCHKVEDPCPQVRVYAGHQTSEVGDFQYQLGEPFITGGETARKLISNWDERKMFGRDNIKALVVPIKIMNTTPLAKNEDIGVTLRDTLGETRKVWPYNSALWAKEYEAKDPWELGKLPPDKWVDTVWVFAVGTEGVENSAMYFTKWETRRYSNGKKYKAVKDQMVMELPAFTVRDEPLPWTKDAPAK